MLRGKKGQLTLFIIAAVVIVVALIIYFYLQGNFLGEKKYDPKVEVLRQTVLDCMEVEYGTSLALIGIQGGYYNVPEPSLEIPAYYFSFFLPYYYHEGELNIPTIETIETELAIAVDQTLLSCFQKLDNTSFESISFNQHSTTVDIRENEVIFTTDIDMTVNYDEKTAIVDFKSTPQTVGSDIFNMHKISSFIAEYLKNNNEWIPYSDITQMSREYDLYVDVIHSEDGLSSNVEILSPKDGFYPSFYQFVNKHGAADLEEIAPLLMTW